MTMNLATKLDISGWFELGQQNGASHMLIVCDTYDYSDYPVYVGKEEDVKQVYESYNGPNMQRVEEVYDLRLPMKEQLAERRTMHL